MLTILAIDSIVHGNSKRGISRRWPGLYGKTFLFLLDWRRGYPHIWRCICQFAFQFMPPPSGSCENHLAYSYRPHSREIICLVVSIHPFCCPCPFVQTVCVEGQISYYNTWPDKAILQFQIPLVIANEDIFLLETLMMGWLIATVYRQSDASEQNR